MEKVAVVTGTSSGIGFETALALAREGYYTYATMRDTTKSGKIKELGKKDNLKIECIRTGCGWWELGQECYTKYSWPKTKDRYSSKIYWW